MTYATPGAPLGDTPGVSNGYGVLFVHRIRMLLEVAQQLRQTRRGHTDHAVRRAVVNVQGVAIIAEDPTAREHDVGHVARLLVGFLGPEHPLVAARQDLGRVVPVQQCQPEPVDRPGCSDPYPVVADKPTVLGEQRRGAEPDFVGVPPTTMPSREQHAGIAPVVQIGAERQPDVSAQPDIAGTGLWINAQRPPKVVGNSAASLSSGGWRTPVRSHCMKSRVLARQTSGPAVEYPT